MSIDLHDWLQRQGLSHLEAVLSEAGLDLDVLGDLTSAELAEIGLSLGDRKRLLKAVAASPPGAESGEGLAAQEGTAPGRSQGLLPPPPRPLTPMPNAVR